MATIVNVLTKTSTSTVAPPLTEVVPKTGWVQGFVQPFWAGTRQSLGFGPSR
jgi:hypothetical protein